MKILFISEHYKHNIQGGGEVNVFTLCEALADKGHEISVLTSGSVRQKIVEKKVAVYQYLETGGVQSLFGNIKRIFFHRQIAGEVEKLQKQNTYDVIHLIGTALGAASSLRKITSVPIYATIESYIALCPKGDFICGSKAVIKPWPFFYFARCMSRSREIGKMQNRAYIRYNPIAWALIYQRYRHLNNSLKCAQLIAISEFMQNILKQFNLSSRVIPNFIDMDAFRQKAAEKEDKKKSKSKNNKTSILYLGSLNEYKGPQILLEAAKNLSCTVHLYGNGILKDNLEKMIKIEKLDAAIHEPVRFEDVPNVYSTADIVVFPSVWPEPFGRIAIEAMAAQRAVIGSSIGGIKEVIRDDCGVLVAPGSVEELHHALQMLIMQEKKRIQLAKNGFAHVKNNYSKEVVIKKLISAYQAHTNNP
ncbi:MAG TPA: glycosyltransferase family 4 protein [Candidatus Nanoarchaeia archaeon]|nr:glycosyltransferase family 4 protein [Candidatus Nanoarchaeia archaeon]